MANINVRVDDKTETILKKEAIALGVSLSDLVRERLTGEKNLTINEITFENRIERLEEQQKKLSFRLLFQSRFLYQFVVFAANEKTAAGAWEAAEKELKEKG